MADRIPLFEPQHDEGLRPPLTNCNPASGAMLADWHSRGGINTSDVLIRQASGIPVNEGMNFAAVSIGLQKIHPDLGEMLYSEHTGARSPSNPGGGNAQITWNELLAHMRDGGFAAVCGDYRNLPADLRRWSPNFLDGHAASAGDLHDNDLFLWGDPLSQGYVRVHINVLWDFIWSTSKNDGSVIVTAAHGFNSPRPPEPTALPFPDVGGHWSIASIQWAKDNGIATGKKDGLFHPDAGATRAEIMAFIHRYDKLRGN